MLKKNGIEDLIERIEQDGAHRVLRRLCVPSGRSTVPYYGGDTFIGVVIDVETTGFDADTDAIIELALRRFRYDGRGRILKVDSARAWREDPGRPLEPEIIRLTGITDGELAGQKIDDDEVVRLLRTAHLVIAHNAAFDRKFVDRRLPGAARLAWACSCREIDWAGAGFDGRALGWLLAQSGWFFEGHRASNDVDAVIALLWQKRADGGTYLAELVDSANCPTVRIEAFGAAFGLKDALRARGYRWDPNGRVWWRDVEAKDLIAEESWLAQNVYGPSCGAIGAGPRLTELTARERYA
jgi:DNA polymerase-3 subunit epsilon